MSTYIKPSTPLEFDNAPDWLVAYMRYRRTILGNTPASVMTDFKTMREFIQWLSTYQATGRSPAAEELRSVDILAFPLTEALRVKRNDIETYLFFCADTLNNGAKTRTKKLAAVRCFYNYVIDQAEVLKVEQAYNPAERIKTPKQPKQQPIFLPEQDQVTLLEAIDGENGARDYAMFLLILSCGLRVSEVVALSPTDINLSSGTLKIHGKGNKERMAYMTPACREAMYRYKEEYRDLIPKDMLKANIFFVSKRTGGGLTTRSVERAMKKYVNAAGIGGMGYTPHKLRHTMATTLAKDGTNLLTIQKLLGHESPTTTQIYTHLGDEDVSNAVSNSSLSHLGNWSQPVPTAHTQGAEYDTNE